MRKIIKKTLSIVLVSALFTGISSTAPLGTNTNTYAAENASRLTLSTDINATATIDLNKTYTIDYNDLFNADINTQSCRDSCYAKIIIPKKDYYTYRFVANDSDRGNFTFALMDSELNIVYDPMKKADIKYTQVVNTSYKGTVLLTPGTYYYSVKCDQYISGAISLYRASDKEEANATENKISSSIKKVTITKVSAKHKGFVVSWKKQTGVKGYQVRYSTSKKMKAAKKSNVSGSNSTKCKVSSLKSKKTYYIQVRAYKTSGKKNIYGAWSSVNKIKTK